MRTPTVVLIWLCLVLPVTGCARPLGWLFDEEPVDAGPPPDASPCGQGPDFQCTRREGGACGMWVTVAPQCTPDGEWFCPSGSQFLEQGSPGSDRCLPFYGPDSPFDVLGTTGAPVERGDGRCMWIMGPGPSFDDQRPSHSAVLMPDSPGTGNCLDGAEVLGGDEPFSVVDESELGEDAIVSQGDGFRWGDRTWFYYRHWVWDFTQVFGVRLLGTRLAWYDETQEKMQLLPGFLWPGEVAFGDAAVVVDGVVHVYGCHGPPVFLSYNCFLARLATDEINDPQGYAHFAGDGQWSPELDHEVAIFESGPHHTAIRFHPGLGEYVLVFAYGFGTDIFLRRAPRPEGPWSAEVLVAPCDLPEDDPAAFCASPALHLELMTDWRPDELVVTYEVGSTSEDQAERRDADPAAYWPRLVRLALP